MQEMFLSEAYEYKPPPAQIPSLLSTGLQQDEATAAAPPTVLQQDGATAAATAEDIKQETSQSLLKAETSQTVLAPEISMEQRAAAAALSRQRILNMMPPLTHTTDIGDDVVVIHVRAGSEYNALLYLLLQVSRHFNLDDVLPEIPPAIDGHIYDILRFAPDKEVNGDASTFFTESSLPRGLVLKRICIDKHKDPNNFYRKLDSTLVMRRRPMLIREQPQTIRRPGLIVTESDIREAGKRLPLKCMFRSRLVPVALPNDPDYLRMAAEVIVEFNKKGLTITPYLESSCRAYSAICQIQALVRGFLLRRKVNYKELVRLSRAAAKIQRAWRRYLDASRFKMLMSMKATVKVLSSLLLGANLALDVQGVTALRNSVGDKMMGGFREHQLHFSINPKGCVYVVAQEGQMRPGLPKWVGVDIPVMTQEEAYMKYGPAQKLYTRLEATTLLLSGTAWRDLKGNFVGKTSLPDIPKAASDHDVLIHLTFPTVAEAAVRTCLLLALTWDPKRDVGCKLVPPHTTNLARHMPLPNVSGRPGGDLKGDKWANLNASSASQAGGEQRPASRQASPSGRGRQAASPSGRRGSPSGRQSSPSGRGEFETATGLPALYQPTVRPGSRGQGSRTGSPSARLPPSRGGSRGSPRELEGEEGGSPSRTASRLARGSRQGSLVAQPGEFGPPGGMDKFSDDPQERPSTSGAAGSGDTAAAGDSGGQQPGEPRWVAPAHRLYSEPGTEPAPPPFKLFDKDMSPWVVEGGQQHLQQETPGHARFWGAPGGGMGYLGTTLQAGRSLLAPSHAASSAAGGASAPRRSSLLYPGGGSAGAASAARAGGPLPPLDRQHYGYSFPEHAGRRRRGRRPGQQGGSDGGEYDDEVLVDANGKPLTPNTILYRNVMEASDWAELPEHMLLLPVDTQHYPGPPHPRMAGMSIYEQQRLMRARARSDGTGQGNPELVVFKEELGTWDVQALRETQKQQAALQRDESENNDAVIRAGKWDKIGDAQQTRERYAKTHQLWVKHTGTGHCLAPSYCPLPPAAMSRLLAKMAEIYLEEAAATVARIRAEHSAAMREARDEQQASRDAVAKAGQQQREVADSVLQRAGDEKMQAVQQRVAYRHMRNMRKQRREHDRQFAHALGRQMNGLGQQLRRGEMAARDAAEAEDAWRLAELGRVMDATTKENIALAAIDRLNMAKWRAAVVRSEGYTPAVASYHAAVDQHTRDMVAWRKDQAQVTRELLGPPAGTWGSKPAESLRLPYPTNTVVSAREAKVQQAQHAQLLAQQQMMQDYLSRSSSRRGGHSSRMGTGHTGSFVQRHGSSARHPASPGTASDVAPWSASASSQQGLGLGQVSPSRPGSSRLSTASPNRDRATSRSYIPPIAEEHSHLSTEAAAHPTSAPGAPLAVRGGSTGSPIGRTSPASPSGSKSPSPEHSRVQLPLPTTVTSPSQPQQQPPEAKGSAQKVQQLNELEGQRSQSMLSYREQQAEQAGGPMALNGYSRRAESPKTKYHRDCTRKGHREHVDLLPEMPYTRPADRPPDPRTKPVGMVI